MPHYKVLTRDEAIRKHREMWNWIAEQTELRKSIVTKSDYFVKLDIEDIINQCFLCTYAVYQRQKRGLTYDVYQCEFCPIDWGGYSCQILDLNYFDDYGIFSQWQRACCAGDYKETARLARVIAELPTIFIQ